MSVTGPFAVAGGYLLGSVPFGFLLGRWRGVDVREVGSGNIGATNVIRAAGPVAGVITFGLDAGKGAVVPALSLAAGLAWPWVAAVALAAVVGHCHSVFLRLRGGKGVATFVGAFAVLDPVAVAAGMAMFAATLVAARYVAVASMALVGVVLVVSVGRHGPVDARTVMAALSFILLAVRHRDNWKRLTSRREGRLLEDSRRGPGQEEP
ncbi:MAG: glycerol-3-phosphate acyltransferase [Acidobacteriota bacterium]